MANKIQELTDKLYEEGLQKGKEASLRLIEESEEKAKHTLAEAEKKAANIVADAEKKAQEIHANTMKELSLASKQALADLKQSVTDMLAKSTVSKPVSETFNNDEFVRGLILETVSSWSAKGNISAAIEVPAGKEKSIGEFVRSSMKSEMAKSPEITGGAVKGGFRVAEKGGGYYISFTDKEFDSFFRSYIRPRVASILFSEEE